MGLGYFFGKYLSTLNCGNLEPGALSFNYCHTNHFHRVWWTRWNRFSKI